MIVEDERYFVDLLDELARLLEETRWHGLLARVEVITRQFVADATPRVAALAEELRERHGLSTLVRL